MKEVFSRFEQKVYVPIDFDFRNLVISRKFSPPDEE